MLRNNLGDLLSKVPKKDDLDVAAVKNSCETVKDMIFILLSSIYESGPIDPFTQMTAGRLTDKNFHKLALSLYAFFNAYVQKTASVHLFHINDNFEIVGEGGSRHFYELNEDQVVITLNLYDNPRMIKLSSIPVQAKSIALPSPEDYEKEITVFLSQVKKQSSDSTNNNIDDKDLSELLSLFKNTSSTFFTPSTFFKPVTIKNCYDLIQSIKELPLTIRLQRIEDNHLALIQVESDLVAVMKELSIDDHFILVKRLGKRFFEMYSKSCFQQDIVKLLPESAEVQTYLNEGLLALSLNCERIKTTPG